MERIRPAELEDIQVMSALETECFGMDAWSEDALRSELEEMPTTRDVLVAELGHEVVGYAVLRVVGTTGDVQRIAVRPDVRRRGIARRLLAALLERGRQRGCEEMLLEVAVGNEPAINLYESAGFTVIARRPRYYRSGADALVLRRALEESSTQ